MRPLMGTRFYFPCLHHAPPPPCTPIRACSCSQTAHMRAHCPLYSRVLSLSYHVHRSAQCTRARIVCVCRVYRVSRVCAALCLTSVCGWWWRASRRVAHEHDLQSAPHPTAAPALCCARVCLCDHRTMSSILFRKSRRLHRKRATAS